MYCKNCGSELNEGAKFCENCGTKVNEDLTSVVQSVVKNATDKVKENEFVQSVKQDIENSQSLNILKDKAKEGFNSAVDKAKEASQNFKSMDSAEKKNSIINGTKKFFNDSHGVTVATLIAAILLPLSWFLPVVKIFGEKFTYLGIVNQLSSSQAKEALAGFWLMVIICAVSVIWAVIPKKWSAIVGTVYSLLPMLICIAQVNDWASNGFELLIGANLMVPFSILVFVLSIIKLITLVKAKKQQKLNVEANQPQNTDM